MNVGQKEVKSKMNSEQFCYWLQGKLEDRNLSTLDNKELQSIKDHLALVFTKLTPRNDKEEIDFNKVLFEPAPRSPSWPPYQPYRMDEIPHPLDSNKIIC